jgi:hypothetical protein
VYHIQKRANLSPFPFFQTLIESWTIP